MTCMSLSPDPRAIALADGGHIQSVGERVGHHRTPREVPTRGGSPESACTAHTDHEGPRTTDDSSHWSGSRHCLRAAPMTKRSLCVTTTMVVMGLQLPSTQAAVAQGLPTQAVTISNESGRTEIPFALRRGQVIITASVNGSNPIRLILDSGAPVMFFPDSGLASRLQLTEATRVQVEGAGRESQPVMAPLATGLTVRLGDVVVSNGLALWGIKAGILGDVDGVIGAPLFQGTVLQLDFDRQVVVIHDPDRYRYEGEGTILPLEHRSTDHLYIRGVGITPSTPDSGLVLHLDTGASQPLGIHPRTPRVGLIPERRLMNTIVVRGTQGVARGDVGLIRRLFLGTAQVRDVVTVFPDGPPESGEDGWIGLPLLSNFNVTFDVPRGRLILDEREGVRQPYRFNTIGFFTHDPNPADGSPLRVTEVISGSPAEAAGLRVGDRITAVDGTTTVGWTRAELGELLVGPPGRRIQLGVRRGTEVLSITVESATLVPDP